MNTIKLDDLLPEDIKVDFLKIDVEGGEYIVIKGVLRILTQQKPYVLFEFGTGAPEFYGVTPEMMYDLIVGEGKLRLFAIDGTGPLSKKDLVSVYQKECTSDFVAHG